MTKLAIALAVVLATVMPASAGAETVTGRFTFTDSNGQPSPIRFAKVEIWRFRPGAIWWVWNADRVTTTDGDGRINESMGFMAAGVIYRVHVFAKNRGATVYTQDVYTTEFFRRAGEPGSPIERKANSASDVLNFDYEFKDDYAIHHFNIADAILHGFDYATAPQRRAPGATDTVAPVDVLLSFGGANYGPPTYYDPIYHLLRINAYYAKDDFTILHEYAHYLEERISSFQGLATYHDGCVFEAGRGGANVASAGLAWMEGFASYFPQAVDQAVPGALQFAPGDTQPRGSTPAWLLETPACVDKPSTLPPHQTEVFVSAALFDIIDRGFSEPNDRLCRTSDHPIDDKVFQVFDGLALGFANPTLQNFVDGWINRGFDLPPLLAAFGSGVAAGLATPSPVPRYDTARAANLAIWRPSDGMWWVAGGQFGVPTQWGMTGDIPVPADYDGDGLTDIAIYRPSDGNWWVVLSRTNRVQVVQWGQQYDVPLPGDYDGDGEDDYAVYRPGSGEVIVHVDGCGWVKKFSFPQIPAGTPVVGDFDGDGDEEPGVYIWESSTFHYYAKASNGIYDAIYSANLGSSGTPLVGDFDGDMRSDLAVYAWGTWYIRRSSTGQTTTSSWGGWNDRPVPADYDGDGDVEIAVWSPFNGEWKINYGPGRYAWNPPRWGEWGDTPVPAR